MPIAPGSSDLTESELPIPPLAEQLQDPTAYDYDGRKSLGLLAASQALQNWKGEGQSLPAKLAPMELPYQLGDHCLDTAPTLGLLVVLVAPDGTFLKGPEVISSTGYTVLDDQAKALVEAGDYSLPQDDNVKAYSVEINVLYPETCL
jgi:hypothetical protein